MELLAPLIKSFLLVFIAEFGDKSQLVCMTLAARYRSAVVLIGAVLAFAALNLLGVTVGVLVAQWVPDWIVLVIVMLLFLLFGIQALRSADEDENDGDSKVGKHLLVSVFLLIFLAEFGDKTQLAVAGLASVESAVGVWLGSTLALIGTTLLGVLAGRTLLQRLSVAWVQRGSGVIFILFALLAGYELMDVLSV
ncbi:TMEM165/GDT1 family protein [Pontibacterium sp.]|uniref:TMEM165/GDT1 family protein n=1 Tax=Pontibacterium sp. TaxID=2036026 RepID=UPI003510D464